MWSNPRPRRSRGGVEQAVRLVRRPRREGRDRGGARRRRLCPDRRRDPNVGAIEGEDFLVCFDVRATPAAAREWLAQLREHTDKPVRHVVLSHYHAVRVLGASAFGAEEIIAHESTRRLIDERGQEDWQSEFGRMPRLFKQPEEILD